MNWRGFAATTAILAAWGFYAGCASMAKEDGSSETTREGLPLLYSEDFEDGAEGWVFTDDKAWEVRREEDNHALALHKSSQYQPPVRSPHSIARIEGLQVSDFVLEARLKQIGKEYGHRDLCIFFGYQDPSHFYYCHIATKADPHAHSIFIVDGKPRLSIAKERTSGADWGTGYHRVRMVRCAESGKIQVYFDDMETPIMEAEDKTFLKGEIGFGSFDDVGLFDDIKVWGKVAP